MTLQHRETMQLLLDSCVCRFTMRSWDLKRLALVIIRKHLAREYGSSIHSCPHSLIPDSPELESSISACLLENFLSLNDASSMAKYLRFLSWLGKRFSVNYLSWVPPLLPKFLSHQECVNDATDLMLVLLTSNPVVAHIVSESVPDCVDRIQAFLTDNKLERSKWIGDLVRSLNHLPLQSVLYDLIESEFLHNVDPTIRVKSIESILSSCGIRENGPELPLITQRLLDREQSVRGVIWDHLKQLPTLEESINSLLILTSFVPVHQEIFNDLDEFIADTITSQYEHEPVEFLNLIFEKSSDKSRIFFRDFFRSKNTARKIIKSVASVIGAKSESNRRGKIEYEKTIRMCLSWVAKTSNKTASIKKLFDSFTIDLIDLLLKLFDPKTLIWPTRIKLIAEIKSMVPPEWVSLFTHSVNLFLDRPNMSQIIRDHKFSHFLSHFVEPEFREEVEEPGLIDWPSVVESIQDTLNEDLIRFFGKISKNLQKENSPTHPLCPQLLEKVLDPTTPTKSRKNLFSGFLWYDSETCLRWIENNANFFQYEFLITQLCLFVKRRKPSVIDLVLSWIPESSSAKYILDISILSRVSALVHDQCLTNLVHAIDVHEDCPPSALVTLVSGIEKFPPDSKMVKKIKKCLTPTNGASADIIAFCGGVRIDLLPVMFFIPSSQSRRRFKVLEKSEWSDSSRRIVEYLVSLFVFITLHVTDPSIHATLFVSQMMEDSNTRCRANVAATVAATLDSLSACAPKTTQKMSRSVSTSCSILRGCLEQSHPGVVRMTLQKTYSLTVGLAMFYSQSVEDEEDNDPLILKRRRVTC